MRLRLSTVVDRLSALLNSHSADRGITVSRGFFISLLFILLFYLPVSYYYSQALAYDNYHRKILPSFEWSDYSSFYPTVHYDPVEGTLTLEETVSYRSYEPWSNMTGLSLSRDVRADGCFTYSYDSFTKTRLRIESNSDSYLTVIRGNNTTKLTGTRFDIPISTGDKIIFSIPLKTTQCVPYVSIDDGSNVYFLRLKPK